MVGNISDFLQESSEYHILKMGLYETNKISYLGNESYCDLRKIHPDYLEINLDIEYKLYYSFAVKDILTKTRKNYRDYLNVY